MYFWIMKYYAVLFYSLSPVINFENISTQDILIQNPSLPRSRSYLLFYLIFTLFYYLKGIIFREN